MPWTTQMYRFGRQASGSQDALAGTNVALNLHEEVAYKSTTSRRKPLHEQVGFILPTTLHFDGTWKNG